MNTNYTEEHYTNVTDSVSVGTHLTPNQQAERMLWKVCSPCLLLVGGFGNVATIFVLQRMKGHNSSQHVFLTALAVADLACLCAYVLPRLLDTHFNVNLVTTHTAPCKLYYWGKGVGFRLSAWLVTAVTVQRTVAITWPHKVRAMCTVRRTWAVVAGIVCVVCALQSHFLVIYRAKKNKCFYDKTAGNVFLMQHIHKWTQMLLNSFLPFVCILVCDIVLSLSLFQATSANSVATQAIASVPSMQSDNRRMDTVKRTTFMLLALSISFIFLTLPMYIVLIVINARREQIDQNPELAIMFAFIYRACRLLVCINSAINFFLYCFTGTRFKREFFDWICCSFGNHSSGSFGKTASVSAKGEKPTSAHKCPD